MRSASAGEERVNASLAAAVVFAVFESVIGMLQVEDAMYRLAIAKYVLIEVQSVFGDEERGRCGASVQLTVEVFEGKR